MANCDTAHPQILQIAIAIPLHCLFDYLLSTEWDPQPLAPGIRVLVPFGKTRKIGVLCAVRDVTGNDHLEKLKFIEQILDREPLLSTQDMQLLQWASHYYHHPLGEVLASAFPVLLRQGKPAQLETDPRYCLTASGRLINPDQLKRAPKQQALLALLTDQSAPISSLLLKQQRATLKILLEKGYIEEKPADSIPNNPISGAMLSANPEQQTAINAITASLGKFSAFLLEGITGSGKTEVYMQAISYYLSQGLQILLLLPEIALTPQLEQRFQQRFSVKIVTFHSKLTENQRLNAWLNMQQGKASIMLGTRSALFTPLNSPGLIILDEEHDSSFKQQEGFRFSARDVAIIRAKNLNIPVVLGSATPSLESLYNVARARYQLLTLPNRAGKALEPVLQLLDIRNKPLHAGLSEALLFAIKTTLEQAGQVLLFLNRRGFAPVQICHSCGWVSRCQRCDANLVLHASEQLLRCHHCAAEHAVPTHCPNCKSAELVALGLGTERIEQTLKAHFSNKTILRLDKDSTQRKGAMENFLQQIHAGEADIILGTQMLAKGHHFPNVTLVGLVDIDSGLFSIDYRAGEKLAQMIVQVAGRAGRANKPGKVILQTRHPQHPLLVTLLDKGYQAFAQVAMQERREAQLPPFTHQVLIRAHATDAQGPALFLSALNDLIAMHASGQILVLGPVAAPMLRRAGLYRFQLLLQSPNRSDLHRLLDNILPLASRLKTAKNVRWSVDVDPLDLY